MIDRRREGAHTIEIASEFYVSRATVYKYMKLYDLRKSYLKAYEDFLKAKCDKAIELRKEGFTLEEIGEDLGIESTPSLYMLLQRKKRYDEFLAAKSSPNYRVHNKSYSGHTERLNFSWVYNQRAVFGRYYHDIAAEVGCSTAKVMRFCQKYNIPKADKQTALANRSNANKALEKAW